MQAVIVSRSRHDIVDRMTTVEEEPFELRYDHIVRFDLTDERCASIVANTPKDLLAQCGCGLICEALSFSVIIAVAPLLSRAIARCRRGNDAST